MMRARRQNATALIPAQAVDALTVELRGMNLNQSPIAIIGGHIVEIIAEFLSAVKMNEMNMIREVVEVSVKSLMLRYGKKAQSVFIPESMYEKMYTLSSPIAELFTFFGSVRMMEKTKIKTAKNTTLP